jgi:hypothetical protein
MQIKERIYADIENEYTQILTNCASEVKVMVYDKRYPITINDTGIVAV